MFYPHGNNYNRVTTINGGLSKTNLNERCQHKHLAGTTTHCYPGGAEGLSAKLSGTKGKSCVLLNDRPPKS